MIRAPRSLAVQQQLEPVAVRWEACDLRLCEEIDVLRRPCCTAVVLCPQMASPPEDKAPMGAHCPGCDDHCIRPDLVRVGVSWNQAHVDGSDARFRAS